MKIEIYTSVSGTAFWNGLVHGLESRGFSVEVFSVMTEEEYRQPRGFFSNLWRRWQLYGGMGLRTRRQVGRPVNEPTCRIVTTNPFFLPDMVRTHSLRSSNVRLLNFVLDLYPEALVLAGRHIGSKTKYKLEAMAGRAIQKCDASIFLGEKLRKYAIDKYGPAKETKVIPVGADARPFAGMTPKSIPVGRPVRFLYCGVLGRMHEVDTLAELGLGKVLPGCEWLVHASGTGVEALRGTWFQLGGALRQSDWVRTLQSAQVGVVTIRPGAEKIVMPSKTYSALAAGQAILAVCPKDSDLAELIRELDCGWVIEPGDAEGLRQRILEICRNREMLLQKRLKAFLSGQGRFSSDSVAGEWVALAERLFS